MKLTLVAILALFLGISHLSFATPIQDADGNVLPEVVENLIGLSRAPEQPFKSPAAFPSDWTNDYAACHPGGGGLVGVRSVEPSYGNPDSEYFIVDMCYRERHIRAAIIRQYQPDRSWTVTDVLRLKRWEGTAWGRDCDEEWRSIPAGYRLGAVMDIRSKPRYKSPECSIPYRPAKRAYLLNVVTGKLRPYSAKGISCRFGDDSCAN